MNNVVLTGRLVRDPELKFMPSNGTAVSTFTLAVDKELSKDIKEDFESKGKPTADFIRIVAYGKIAENCANYLKKGLRTGVEGRINTRSWETQEGDKRYLTEVKANKVEFIDWANDKKDSSSGNKPENDTFEDEFFETDYDDDIPF